MPTPCFLIVPTGYATRELRRFTYSNDTEPKCPSGWGHDASRLIGRRKVQVTTRGKHKGCWHVYGDRKPPRTDPRWPKTCERCAYRFKAKDEWQLFHDRLYVRASGGEGETYSLRQLPPGAMYDADWYPWKGPDGKSLMVQTPGGMWNIDGPASNCGMPDDQAQQRHHCWCRHGEPPMITVDKDCVTCAAGAGSIQAGSYHGFLQGGVLT